MAKLKEVKLKIAGVKKTRQITSAMKMVATSRLRGAQMGMEAFRPYASKFAEVLGSLAAKSGGESSPLLVPREEVKKVHIILCTSDRGLCGGFNMNLIDLAERYLKKQADKNIEISFTAFGKRGRDWCKKSKLNLVDQYIGVVGANFGFNVASTSGRKLINEFLASTYDEVHVIYARFISVGKQVPIIQQILPIPPIESVEEDKVASSATYLPEHICEPSPEELLNDMLPRNVFIQIHSALLETSTSEHAARMTAMDNATKACNDMVNELKRLYNKVRQAAITADLMDIVGGAEALKG
jgi:F-type H+-transporting ATPase subunit gamma